MRSRRRGARRSAQRTSYQESVGRSAAASACSTRAMTVLCALSRPRQASRCGCGRVLGESLTRAWRAGAGPGEERLVVDVDSFVREVHGHHKQGAAFGYTRLRGYHPLVATRAETRVLLHLRLRKGSANTQRVTLRFVDELVARLARAGAGGVKLWALRLLEREAAGAAGEGGLALLNRGAGDRAGTGAGRADPRARLADARRLPLDGRGADLRDPARRRRLVGRRVRTLAAQGELFPDWQHFPSLTTTTRRSGSSRPSTGRTR